MFTRIDIERARDKLTIKQLAVKSGIKYDALLCKLNGKTEFTRSEMLKIQHAFSAYVPLEELFSALDDAACYFG